MFVLLNINIFLFPVSDTGISFSRSLTPGFPDPKSLRYTHPVGLKRSGRDCVGHQVGGLGVKHHHVSVGIGVRALWQ